ncbi:MAG: hypothetical protein MR392_02205 [Roseburia sp.]|nr:hypothetical protein [Roseburia sp.]
MKYQVIILLDESRNKSYYHNYTISADEAQGNIACDELPPFADVNKARSCYWDFEAERWVYDADKEAEIQEQIAEAKAADEKAKAEAEATPTNMDLADAVMELGNNVSDMMDALTELAQTVSDLKGGE